MPKGIRNTESPVAGMFFKGTEEQFATLMGLAALVNEREVTLERVARALDVLDAIEGVGTPVAIAPKMRATKKTVAKKPGPKPGKKIAQKAPVAKKRKYTRRAKPGTEEAAAK